MLLVCLLGKRKRGMYVCMCVYVSTIQYPTMHSSVGVLGFVITIGRSNGGITRCEYLTMCIVTSYASTHSHHAVAACFISSPLLLLIYYYYYCDHKNARPYVC